MTDTDTPAYQSERIAQEQGPASASLDTALEYLRIRGGRLLPLYVIAVLPLTVVMLFLIDIVSGERRALTASLAAALIPATFWRWAWLARIQQLVQQEIQYRPGLKLRPRLLRILLARLYAFVALTWGGVVVFPAFYGVFASLFIAPFMLEHESPPVSGLFRLTSWVHHSGGRLFRVSTILTCLLGACILAAFIVEYAFARHILPSFFGVDPSGLILTLRGSSWILSTFFFIALFFDFYLAIAGVFLYYDSQSRRTGADLRLRLERIKGRES